MRTLTTIALLVALYVPSTLAQNAVAGALPDDQALKVEGPKVVTMTVRPAAEPRPALKYLLLPDALDIEPGSATTLYFTAIQLRAAKSDEVNNKLSDWVQKPLAELPMDQVRKVLTDNADALRYVTLAARRERCDWDLPIRTEGFDLLLPQLSDFRNVARLLALKARVQIIDRQYEDAAATVQTGFAMARHMAEGPTLINGLVGVAVAALMADQLRELVQAPEAPNLYWAIANLPTPLVDLRTGLEYEKSILFMAAPPLRTITRDRMSPEEARKIFDKVISVLGYAGDGTTVPGPSVTDRVGAAAYIIKALPAAKRYMLAQGRTAAEVEAMPVQQVVFAYSLARYLEMRDDMFKWFRLPFWQAAPGLQEAERRLAESAKDPLRGLPFTALLPSLGRAYFNEARLDRQMAALRCVELVRMHVAYTGAIPASLDAIRLAPVPIDPVTGKFFQYEATGDTFTLVSPPPPGGSAKDGLRYVVTVTK